LVVEAISTISTRVTTISHSDLSVSARTAYFLPSTENNIERSYL